jgi:molecular chaperone GrpE
MTSDTNGSPAESAPEVVKTNEEGGNLQDDPLAPLKSELAAANSELERCQDRFLRKAAEFDNYRKRMEKEKAESVLQAKSLVVAEFLPVADACERALASLGNDTHGADGLEHYREGVRLIYKQIGEVLSRIGVLPIDAQGKPFDPHLHEAVTREENSEHEENTVLLELRRGYLFRDRLLRAAQVKVSARPRVIDSTGS